MDSLHYKAIDIAKCLIKLLKDDNITFTKLKIQKLLYFSQSYSISFLGMRIKK